ncbi:hypothetical protein BC835DRAFT_1239538, partial [Cytidiella melzeri]
ISHRISLRFLPSPPSELTHTLVLNGGSHTRFFTDFRPLVDHPTECEWAFAGMKVERKKCVWEHLVDSRWVGSSGREGEREDVGVCFKLANGDELERGEMVDVGSGGIVREYEEVWRDEVVPS